MVSLRLGMFDFSIAAGKTGELMNGRLILIGILMMATGCATRVFPPKAPANPTKVYLCDYAEHSDILMPTGNGAFVEYVYGDWEYAALNQTSVWHSFKALFISSQAALGRRTLTAQNGEAFPHPPNKPRGISEIVVNGDKVAATVKAMDERYQKHIDTKLFNDAKDYGYTFVKDDQPYHMWHSCNQLTTQNLKDMGCDIGGFPILGNFILMPPR